MKKLILILLLLSAFVATQALPYVQEKTKASAQTETKKKTTSPAKKKTVTKKTDQAKSSTSSSKKKTTIRDTGISHPDNDRDPQVGKTNSGKVVFEGDRGGHYYLTENGNRVYVQDFVGANIIGKTADGKNIYEGPRGGHFYYNNNGDKVYVKR